MAKTPFHISLSHQNRLFGYYASQIEQQCRLLQLIRNGLPDHLAKHACHCLVSNNTLLVYTDSAIWASQLRFYQQSLLAQVIPIARETVLKLQIKVMVQSTGATTPTLRKVNIPSRPTIELMQKQCDSVKDEALQHALRRLNGTLQRLADAV